MGLSRDDLSALRALFRDLTSKITCSTQINIRPICLSGEEEGCFNAYGIYQTDTTGTTLLRIETIDGVPYELEEGQTVVSCSENCEDLLS